jgi:hypothetical protein
MKHFEVIRSYLPNGTVGYMDIAGYRLQTMERPWLLNESGKSCIFEGTYLVERDYSGRWQYYSITGTVGRTFIEIHPANKVSQLAGCLALGMERSSDNVSLINSEDAIDILLKEAGEESFYLTFRQFNPHTDGAMQ